MSLPDPGPGEKWDAFHQDPTQDVIIKSIDGVLFRASSHRLSQIRSVCYTAFLLCMAWRADLNSTVLADMFSLPPTSEDITIEMRHVSGTIRFFLDCASSSILPKTPVLPLATAWDLRAMVDFFDCKRLTPLAQLALSRAAEASPMEYLTMAADTGDMKMVKAALSYGTGSDKPVDATKFLQILPKLDAETQKLLIEKMATIKTKGNKIELQWPVASRCIRRHTTSHVRGPEE